MSFEKPGGVTWTNTPRDSLLVERQKTHGDFMRNAQISQAIKDIYKENGYDEYTSVQREALEMIALKLARILSGQPTYADHWDDIAGYAKLASASCPKSQS